MYVFVVIVHIITCLLLILVVLTQTGRMGGFGGIFGGGGGEQLFSTPSGSEFLRKTTAILAVIFFLTTISMTYLGYRRGIRTVTSQIPITQQQIPQQPQE